MTDAMVDASITCVLGSSAEKERPGAAAWGGSKASSAVDCGRRHTHQHSPSFGLTIRRTTYTIICIVEFMVLQYTSGNDTLTEESVYCNGDLQTSLLI